MTNPKFISAYRAREIVARRMAQMLVGAVTEEQCEAIAKAEDKFRDAAVARRVLIDEIAMAMLDKDRRER